MVATGTVAQHCTRRIPPFEPSTPIFAVPTNFLCRSNKAISGPPQLFCVLFWDIDGAPEFLADCEAGDAQRRLGPVIGLMISGPPYRDTVKQVLGSGEDRSRGRAELVYA